MKLSPTNVIAITPDTEKVVGNLETLLQEFVSGLQELHSLESLVDVEQDQGAMLYEVINNIQHTMSVIKQHGVSDGLLQVANYSGDIAAILNVTELPKITDTNKKQVEVAVLEGLKENVIAAWDAIIKWLTDLWYKFLRFVLELLKSIEKHKRILGELKSKLNSAPINWADTFETEVTSYPYEASTKLNVQFEAFKKEFIEYLKAALVDVDKQRDAHNTVWSKFVAHQSEMDKERASAKKDTFKNLGYTGIDQVMKVIDLAIAGTSDIEDMKKLVESLESKLKQDIDKAKTALKEFRASGVDDAAKDADLQKHLEDAKTTQKFYGQATRLVEYFYKYQLEYNNNIIRLAQAVKYIKK